MEVKVKKVSREGASCSDEHTQKAAACDSVDDISGDSILLVDDDMDSIVLNSEQEEVSRREEVENIFDSIFGRVGCYNCGLVGLDVKLSPEDIMQFDTQAQLQSIKPAVHDS